MSDFEEAMAQIGQARAELDRQVQQAAERKRALQQLSADIGTTRVAERSPRNEVEVTAGAQGAVSGVRISADAFARLDAASLGRIITRTIAAAQHRAAARAVERSAELLGPDSPVIGQLRSDVERSFPMPGDGDSPGYR
jgi:DNA-binding protein YbaB